MKIIGLNKITAGGHHAWYNTDVGILIRKPIGNYIGKKLHKRNYVHVSWWRKIINWFKRWLS